MKLNEIADRPGSRKRAMRVGRGQASGKGKTAGRGHKGQKSRSGVALRGREGGQMPIHMRLPKRGFRNPFAQRYSIVDLARLNAAIDAGKIDGAAPITSEVLSGAGLIRSNRPLWRLLGKTKLERALKVCANHVSAGARASIEAAGGSVEIKEDGKAAAAKEPKRPEESKESKKPEPEESKES
ncbi:MAG: 50S ribosomal protein L15 [Hyphomicrobiales bacterium]|nr:50S ribosomal protein L15 [Hyphomicrobiales bacterium]MCY4049249.1 50S ribosomal protein L15 [Hyphomicrobiales bacterium]